MAAYVAQALELQRHLLVQASTGTGKSLGYLVPALARVGESDQPIVVATATLALQAQIVNRDIPRLLQALEPRPGRRRRWPCSGPQQLPVPAQAGGRLPPKRNRTPSSTCLLRPPAWAGSRAPARVG